MHKTKVTAVTRLKRDLRESEVSGWLFLYPTFETTFCTTLLNTLVVVSLCSSPWVQRQGNWLLNILNLRNEKKQVTC